MSSTVAGPATATAERPVFDAYTEARVRARRRRTAGAATRTAIQAALIVIWCLLPFYWMVVTSFRDVQYTFEPNPFPDHLTLQNYATAFDPANARIVSTVLWELRQGPWENGAWVQRPRTILVDSGSGTPELVQRTFGRTLRQTPDQRPEAAL